MLSDEKKPGAHTMHALALARENVPYKHWTHSDAASPEYCPRAQSRQAELSVADENVPALHAAHWTALVIPENWPGRHDRQEDASASGYLPVPQAVQEVLPNDEMAPSGHDAHNAASSAAE